MEDTQNTSRLPTDESMSTVKNEGSKEYTQNGHNTSSETDDNGDSSIFYGSNETQVSEHGGSLQTCLLRCEKNPGHTAFVPANEFNISHLPDIYKNKDILTLIKCIADLTLRICVTYTSKERPQCWPNTDHPYAFCENGGSNIQRLGTGMIWYVNKKYNEGICPCHKCKQENTPSTFYGEVWVLTAKHLVFDDEEAEHTTSRLFYDSKDSSLVTLDGWKVHEANIDEDWCQLKCVTCDVELMDKLYRLVDVWGKLRSKVNKRYKALGDTFKLALIVSHPHGCNKQISVGEWIKRHKVNDLSSKYTYTACTCPGSSGAYVCLLGYFDHMFSDLKVHSGVNSKGVNFSATGCYCV